MVDEHDQALDLQLIHPLCGSAHDFTYADGVELDGLEHLEHDPVPVLARIEDRWGGRDALGERGRGRAEDDAVRAEGVEAGDQVVREDAAYKARGEKQLSEWGNTGRAVH